jgi:hypothetical protein
MGFLYFESSPLFYMISNDGSSLSQDKFILLNRSLSDFVNNEFYILLYKL